MGSGGDAYDKGGVEENTPKPRFKLSAELSDGITPVIVSTKQECLSSIDAWIDEFGSQPGESFYVTIVSMTDNEIANLPEI